MVLGGYYLLLMLRRVIFGPLREPSGHAHDSGGHASEAGHEEAHEAIRPVGWHEIAGLSPLMFLIVAIGVYPRPIFEQIQPAVQLITQNVQSQRDRAQEVAKAARAFDDSVQSSRNRRRLRPPDRQVQG